MVTALLIAPPFLIYLTPLYPLMLSSTSVSGTVSVALVGCGFVYAASRLQIDPMPRQTHHGLTLVIALIEILADGLLGLVLWLGPLLAHSHPGAHLGLHLDARTDQVIGAGVWWLGGDVAGLPFLLAIMTRFAADDDRRARLRDAEEDLPDDPRDRALWWQNDPYLAERFRPR